MIETTPATVEDSPAARADAIIRRWWAGERADAQAVLAQHPDLADNKDQVIALAYEEFRQRSQRGERLTFGSFASRFPYRSSVVRALQTLTMFESLIGAAQQPDWPKPGDTLLGFRVVEELGRGAVARVYFATEAELGNRPVAVKIALRGGGEASTLGRLRHDNIVPVHSIRQNVANGMTAVCMPYLGRATLCDVIDRAFRGPESPQRARVILAAVQPAANAEEMLGPSTPSAVLLHGTYVEGVVDLALQLCEALAFVHERQIFHRDLKPSNVLVRPDGRPMLLDFNVSFDPQAEEQAIGGTPIYMSPEHIRALQPGADGPCLLDARSDLYSLGLILYELLSGRHPCEAVPCNESPEEQMRQVAELQQAGIPSVRQACPQVDRKVAEVVDRCLAVDPKDRFQSARELGQALRRCLSPARRLRRRLARHPRVVLSAALAATALVVALAVFLAVRPPAPERQFRQGIEAYQEGRYAEAVEHFDRSLKEESSARAFFARGRAQLKLGMLHQAVDDLTKAEELAPGGLTAAALAYGYNQLARDRSAAALYKKAITLGFATPIVYNNLGLSLMRFPGTYHEAAESLKKAIALDPRLQAPYCNLAVLELRTVSSGRVQDSAKLVKSGLWAMAKALDLGESSSRMHFDAACLYVLAAKFEDDWRGKALAHLKEAVREGMTAADFQFDRAFRPLHLDPEYKRLRNTAPVTAPPLRDVPRLLDPIDHRTQMPE